MQTKYPILMVHGFTIKDSIFFKAWGKIDRILAEQGYTIIKSDIDGVGTIENNAFQLKEEIEKILKETGAEKVNIIAHSKGGVDAKYMIMNTDISEHVASLTTLCSPHYGSPIASFVLRLPKFALKAIAFLFNTWYRILGDKHPDVLTACEQLRRVESPENETLNINKNVMCQSFSAKVNKGDKKQDFVMAIPVMFSRYLEKGRETDGFVPRDSTIFGVYRGDCLGGSVSHMEIVDFMVRGKKREKIFAFYTALCEDLAKQGF